MIGGYVTNQKWMTYNMLVTFDGPYAATRVKFILNFSSQLSEEKIKQARCPLWGRMLGQLTRKIKFIKSLRISCSKLRFQFFDHKIDLYQVVASVIVCA